MSQSDKSLEGAMLDKNPSLRRKITESEEFRNWQATLPTIDLDGDVLYLAWGDVPMDEDQIAYHWAQSNGVLQAQEPEKQPESRKKRKPAKPQ